MSQNQHLSDLNLICNEGITSPAEEEMLRKFLKEEIGLEAKSSADYYKQRKLDLDQKAKRELNLSDSFLRTLMYMRQANDHFTKGWTNHDMIDELYRLKNGMTRHEFLTANPDLFQKWYPAALLERIRNRPGRAGEVPLPKDAETSGNKKWSRVAITLLALLFLSAVYWFLTREPAVQTKASTAPLPDTIAYEVYFRGVHDDPQTGQPKAWMRGRFYFVKKDSVYYQVWADSMFSRNNAGVDYSGVRMHGRARFLAGNVMEMQLTYPDNKDSLTCDIKANVSAPFKGQHADWGVFSGYYLGYSGEQRWVTAREGYFVPARMATPALRDCFEQFILERSKTAAGNPWVLKNELPACLGTTPRSNVSPAKQ